MQKCIDCGMQNKDDANFCKGCGKKLRSTCNCWVLKKDNYDCGESRCPGLNLFRLLKIHGSNY